MINIAFWNTYCNKNIDTVLSAMMAENSIDILGMCEYSGNADLLVLNPLLKKKGYRIIKPIAASKQMPIIYSTETVSYKGPIADQDRYSVHEFMIDGISFLISFVHLPSKMMGDNEMECKAVSGLILHDIKEWESKQNKKRTMIVGDFNLDPYEKTILWADGFHAYPDSIDAEKKKTIQKVSYESFYNPMWNMFGDKEYPPGTYYFRKPGRSAQWHVFDQVIMRYDMTKCFDKKSLRIITRINQFSLADKNGRPNKAEYSDHFPIFFSIGGKING